MMGIISGWRLASGLRGVTDVADMEAVADDASVADVVDVVDVENVAVGAAKPRGRRVLSIRKRLERRILGRVLR